MRKNVSWFAVMLVAVMALGAVLLSGVRSAVGRALDLAEYKAADPYYQSLALRDQVAGNGRSDALLWVVGGILAVLLVGWLLSQAAPALKEARLTYKTIRPRRTAARRPASGIGRLTTLPTAPLIRALPDGNQPETVDYEDVDESDVDVWSGGR